MTSNNNKHSADILLNKFQIKNKRYLLLLNSDHIVWQRLDAKRNHEAGNTTKQASVEAEQIGNGAVDESGSQVVHIDEVFRVVKGVTKAATLRVGTPYASSILNANEQLSQPIAPPREQHLSIHYAERVVKSHDDCNRWRVQCLTLFNADPYVVQQWHAAILRMLNESARLRVRRLLVFINPYGGCQEGLQTYERCCKPLFQLAGIDASCIISQRANQIRDILMSHDLATYDAVCCVGGDGTVAEVINGLIFRTMHDLNLDSRQPVYVPRPPLPVGIISAGSTNTVAYSLHGTEDATTAAIHLVLGQCRGLDICSVRNKAGIVRFCASVLSYGYLGDVAAKSEKYRWMGPKRYEFTGFKSFLLNRGYEAEVRLLVDNDNVDSQKSNADVSSPMDSICYVDCKQCSAAGGASGSQQLRITKKEFDSDDELGDELPTSSNMSLCTQKDTAEDAAVEVNDIKSALTIGCDRIVKSVVAEASRKQETTNDNSLHISAEETILSEHNDITVEAQSSFSFDSNSSLNNNNAKKGNRKWKVIKGTFFMISGTNITCACSRSPNGMSRYNHLGNGYLDLILVRKTTLLNSARFAMNVMKRNGDTRNLPFVEVYRTRQFRFHAQSNRTDDIYSVSGSCHPITEEFVIDSDEDHSISSWNCDGEIITDLDIIMTSHCQLINVFMRGPYPYNKPEKKKTGFKLFCCSSK